MKLIKVLNQFKFMSKYSERNIPSKAGFWWDDSKKIWWTDYIDHASSLVQYADASCKTELEDYLKQKDIVLKKSIASANIVDIQTSIRDGGADPEYIEYLKGIGSIDGQALYDYQIAGIACAAQMSDVYLADENGLGKTAQSLFIAQQHSPEGCLVVAPPSAMPFWKAEAKRWVGWESVVINKSPECAIPLNFHGLVICSWKHLTLSDDETMSDTESKELNPHLKRNWKTIIFDEATYVKNLKAGRGDIAFGNYEWDSENKSYSRIPGLVDQSEKFIAVTGNAIPQPKQVYELRKILAAMGMRNNAPLLHLARSNKKFTEKYCDNCLPKSPQNAPSSHVDELLKLLGESSIMIHRTLKDALPALPLLRRQFIPIQMENADSPLFTTQNPPLSHDDLAKHSYRCNPTKVEPFVKHILCAVDNGRSPIIFCRNTEVADSLQRKLRNICNEADVIHEEIDPQKKQKSVARYVAQKSKVIILTYGSCSNIEELWKQAELAIFIELSPDPNLLKQAEGCLISPSTEKYHSVLCQYFLH